MKDYYVELTDIVREYVEYRYRIPALESTTAELPVHLQRTGIPQRETDRLLRILILADTVKFARARPLPDDHSRCMQDARAFLEATRPQPATPSVDAAANGQDKSKTPAPT